MTMNETMQGQPLGNDMQLILALIETGCGLTKKLDRQLSVYGVSFSELMVLHHLMQAPEMQTRRIDLATEVGLTASGITRMLKPMEKLGWVAKADNPRDARVSLVMITDAGQGLYQDAFASMCDRAGTLIDLPSLSVVSSLINQIKNEE